MAETNALILRQENFIIKSACCALKNPRFNLGEKHAAGQPGYLQQLKKKYHEYKKNKKICSPCNGCIYTGICLSVVDNGL